MARIELRIALDSHPVVAITQIIGPLSMSISSSINLTEIRSLLTQIADAELLPRFQHSRIKTKTDGSLVTEADLAMQQQLQQQLTQLHPQIPVLGEEMPSDEQSALLADTTQGLWVLDPLDGTTNFATGMPCFAVSLALIRNNHTELGLIYDPLRGECFHAITGQGAWLNGTPLQLNERRSTLGDCIAMVDLKRLPPELGCRLVSEPPYRSQRSIGSIALDWCWLAAGRLQLYLHGSSRLWDYAAGRLIFSEAGGLSRLQESFMANADDNQSLHPKIAIAATNRHLFELWGSWLDTANNK
ncbi:Archaeal fructose-1,6-bisphosphatase or related enzyme of inositol monophosphatase family [endosymbiont of Ridgeia piscesae]|uniref:Archaeal fructose-1,6-bisphosphatase or related enzyme of inositol monophosphatase family n=2 Tax=endosymbiont of Ridgeia piscesae TaxID=54398 RepID=A0A0T5Z415_9GAMM|nr:Archaeal fructose-1,6-bisphosphatase or related enzyme of inositol monophosphatase family [endosymbiont of Ridgeia piscesae]KRT57592.1 myo-inositol-1(or 4)-monophosphatase [endosymbiont of Ridgeia piscesae]